jgi:hypothetical protein
VIFLLVIAVAVEAIAGLSPGLLLVVATAGFVCYLGASVWLMDGQTAGKAVRDLRVCRVTPRATLGGDVACCGRSLATLSAMWSWTSSASGRWSPSPTGADVASTSTRSEASWPTSRESRPKTLPSPLDTAANGSALLIATTSSADATGGSSSRGNG